MILNYSRNLSAPFFVFVIVFIGGFTSSVSLAANSTVRVGYPQPSGAILPLWLVSDAKLDLKYGVPVQNIFISGAARMNQSMVAGDIDLLYIDGAHRYQPVREDIEVWGARVGPGGTMLMHDAFNAIGVTLAQLRLLLLSSSWRYQGRERSLARYRRARLDARARARNALVQLGGLPYFVRNLVVKILIVAKLRPLAALLGCREDWPY